MSGIEDSLTPAQRAALDENDRRLAGDLEFAPTDEERARWAASDSRAQAVGAKDWQLKYSSHLEMRRSYAYVDDDDAVVYLPDPSRVYSWRGFCNKTAGSTRPVIGPRGGEKQVLVAKDWLEDDERITVKTFTFRPNAPRLTENIYGQRAVNLWSPPEIARQPLPEDWDRRAAIFSEHLHYLIPDPQEARLCLLWFAHLVQHPEVMPGWHLLLIAENVFGTGRNWLSHCMAKQFPRTTVEDLPLKRLLGGNFNSEIECATLGVVDEIREGGRDQWEREQDLRSFLTAKSRTINAKFRAPYVVQNFLRVLIFSNHADALPIPESDRRLFVARCTTTPRSKEYYDGIYAALKDMATLRSIHEFLNTRSLEGFDIEGRAPESAAKREAIDAARSDEETELRSIINTWPHEVIRSEHLRQRLQAFRSSDLAFGSAADPQDAVISFAAMRRLYRACGVAALGQMRTVTTGSDTNRNKGRSRIVALKNAARWKQAEERELRKAVEDSDATFKAWEAGADSYEKHCEDLERRRILKAVR